MSIRHHTRWMVRRDMPEVLQIEHASYDYPWCEDDFIRLLRQRTCIGIVVGGEKRSRNKYDKIIGFMLYELHKTKIHILNFAVHPNHRRIGVGSQMASDLVNKLTSRRKTRIVVEVRETNLDAQLFLSRIGFRATNVCRSVYDDTGEDSYIMQYRILDSIPENRIHEYI